MHIAVTGANGFVGRSLISALNARGHRIRALVRYPDAGPGNENVETIATGPIEAISDWRSYLTGIDTVIHLAARSHIADKDMDDAALFRAVNTTATLTLAQSALKRKVRHFIYLSSVGVHGNETQAGHPFHSGSPYNPQNNYAQSKAEAEAGLRALQGSGMRISVMRPPLIYGKGSRGNFRALCSLVANTNALPFSAVKNARSIIAVENLSGAICAVIEQEGSGFAADVVSDGRDFSLPQLVKMVAAGLQKKCLLYPAPLFLLLPAASLLGKGRQMRALTQSLQVDDADFRREFAFRNTVEPEAALPQAAAWLTKA